MTRLARAQALRTEYVDLLLKTKDPEARAEIKGYLEELRQIIEDNGGRVGDFSNLPKN